MAIINLFTRQQPSFLVGGNAALEFDAVFEDTLEAGVQYTQYPVEIGGQASDHGIIQNARYTITASVSNNPLSLSVTDLAFGLASNFLDEAGVLFGGFLASFLAGSNSTRAGATLEALFNLMYARTPFDVFIGEATINNMVITEIVRTKNPANEQTLEFTATLQELPSLATVISRFQPGQQFLQAGQPEQTQSTALLNKGEVRLRQATSTAVSLISGAL